MSKVPSNVVFTSNIGETLKKHIQSHNYSQVGVIVDGNTLRHCYPIIKDALPHQHKVIEIETGEEHKNLNACSDIWHLLTKYSFDRKSVLINLGGGVIGDMGGFCAATFKRGINFINIPTTLLAQVDASVGGKLGIDFEGYKNHIGVFQDPQAVLISTEFLKTLDIRELQSGFAEVIKHSLIADKDEFYKLIRRGLEEQNWEDIIPHNVAIKSEIVANDPTEKGLRKILNFGHTIGHAVETHFINRGSRMLHGEAIAVGMICEAWLSTKHNKLSEEELNSIVRYIMQIFPGGQIDVNEFGSIAHLTIQDKKNEANKINASLLESIGKCLYNIEIVDQDVVNALQYYNQQLEKFSIK